MPQSHDDGALLQNSLLELLMGQHNGTIQENLILQVSAEALAQPQGIPAGVRRCHMGCSPKRKMGKY